MSINAKNIVVKNKDAAHLKSPAPEPQVKFEPPKKRQEDSRAAPVQKKIEAESDGLFAKKKSKFLDDMLNSK